MIININGNFNGLIASLKTLANKQTTTLVVATSLVGVMRTRIHEEGKDSEGGQIGTYSKGYMSVRTGQFKTNSTATKGKSKGQLRGTGVFTKGKDKGSPRPVYNRTAETKVILSLTRQQESDWSVVEVKNQYGIGYKNPLNFQKSQWEEETYKKKIFDLTTEEQALADETINTYINNVFS